MRLPEIFFERKTLKVAKDLLGCFLVRKISGRKIIGCIIETEAYCGPEDLANHASRGRTKRTEVMFGPAGQAYIYLIYGIYHCLNIVTGKKDTPEAVLIRALEYENSDGPGKLCRAFGLSRSHNGLDLKKGPIYIEDRGVKIPKNQILKTPRIGVAYAGSFAKKPWRFLIKDAKLS